MLLLLGIVGGMSTFFLIRNFNERYTEAFFAQISNMIQVIPLVVDGDAMERIDSLDDFGRDDYMKIRSNLLDAFNRNRDDWNRGYYFALYRIIDERLYGFMYMNGAIGMYHPFDWLTGDEDPGVYDLAWQGEIASEMVTDISGDWIYGVGPIYNRSGDVVGLFETGTDLYALNLENQRVIRDLIWELITLSVILLLLLAEISTVAAIRRRRHARLPRGADDKGFSDADMARPLSFLLFCAVGLSTAFLPILSRDLSSAGIETLGGWLIAMPLSAEMGFFGLAMLISPALTRRGGWKPSFFLALLIAAAGLVFSAFPGSLGRFIMARSLTGFGTGIGYQSLKSLIDAEARRMQQKASLLLFYRGMIGGISVGLILGASLSEILGYQNVFLVGAGLLGLTAAVTGYFYRNLRYVWTLPRGENKEPGGNPHSLIKSTRMLLHIGLLALLAYAAASYVRFYFPLFASERGLGVAEIGRLMTANVLLIVNFGPAASRLIVDRFGKQIALVLSAILWAAALSVAGGSNGLLTAGIILLVMGLIEGVSIGAQNAAYFERRAVLQTSDADALRMYETFGKFAESAGPVIFAIFLLAGQLTGLIALAIAVPVFAIAWILILKFLKSPE